MKNVFQLIDILTLATTGSEMDCGGVISNLEIKDKIGLLFPVMQPKVSFLDSTNTYTVSKYQTACGAADMLNHIMEVYFNMNQDLYMLDTVMEGLMKTIIKYAPIAMNEPENYEARANLTPRWMEYTLDETTVSKFYQFGCNVFGIDASLPQMEVAKKSIEMVKEFLYQTLELQSSFTKIGIYDSNFEIMAQKAVTSGGLAYAFKPLNEEDVVNIFKMCL